MENREDFHHDELLDRAVDAVLRDPIPGQLPPERVAQLVAVVRQAALEPYPITLIERIKNMKLTTRIAVAATILIAMLGLLSWLVPGGGPALAFADVVEALNGIHTATWKTTDVVKRPQSEAEMTTSVGMFMAPAHERMERTGGGVTSIGIYDGQKDKALTLVPAKKLATVMNLKNLPAGNPFGKTFVGLRETIANAQSGKGEKVERLGIETIDGRRAEAFRLRAGNLEIKIWADPKTSLPVRVETFSPGPTEVRIVMTDFQVGVDLDPALFSVDVPAGYTAEQMQMDFSDLLKNPFRPLAEALGMAAECNGGVFPDTLRGDQGIDGINRHVIPELEKKYGRDTPELRKAANELAFKMGATFGIVNHLTPKDDWHYAGKDVKLGTPDKPIFWCKTRKGDKYQVIYADLSVKEVPPQDVPKGLESEGSPKP